MNAITYTGSSARLIWGYLEAAALGSWTVVCDPTGADLTATVVTCDAFRAAQQPLTFRVPRPTGTWVWPVESLQIADGSLTARLGPPKD